MITRAELDACFSDFAVVTVPEANLPEDLTHAPTRTYLSTLGMPCLIDVVEFSPAIENGIERLVDVYREEDEAPPEGATPELYVLGFAARPFLCVHATLGTVVQADEEGGVWTLNTDLYRFAHVLCHVSRGIDALRDVRTDLDRHVTALAGDTVRVLREADPAAGPAAEASWRTIAEHAVVAMYPDRF